MDASTVTVTDTATALFTLPAAGAYRRLEVTNNDGTDTVWVGPSDIVENEGTPIAPGATWLLEQYTSEVVYGICGTGLTAACSILIV